MAAGGKREGSGRKPKVDERLLIEKLSPLEPKAFKALERALEDKEGWAVKLYFEYLFGKPKQSMDLTTNGKDINLTPISFVGNKDT